MKRKSSWLLSLIMVIAVMCSITAPAFAVETDGVTTVEEGAAQPVSSADNVVAPPDGIPIAPQSAENSLKEGHIKVYIQIGLTEVQYVLTPNFKVQLWDKDNKEMELIGQSNFAYLASNNYYVSTAEFSVPKSATEGLFSVTVNSDGVTGSYSIAGQNYDFGSKTDGVYLECEKDNEYSNDTTVGLTVDAPLFITVRLDQTPAMVLTFYLENTNVAIGNMPVVLSPGEGGAGITKHTTRDGKLALDVSPSGYWQMKLMNSNYTFTNGMSIRDIKCGKVNVGTLGSVELRSVETLETEAVVGKLTVNTTAGTSYPFTSPSWGSYTLNLEKDGVVRQLQCGIGETVMPQIEPGDYNVSVENDEACTVTVPPTLHVGNEGYIEASVSPKYTMEVTKSVNGEQQDYEFKFVGIEDSGTYKGYDATIFAVAPYEVYSLQDLTTERSVQASISPQEPVTKVILGRDIVTGAGASAPHTGDATMYFVWALVALVIVLAVAVIVYRKKWGKAGTRTLSLFLALTLVGGLVIPFQSASATGGSGGQTGGEDGNGSNGTVAKPLNGFYSTPLYKPENAGMLRITFMFNPDAEGDDSAEASLGQTDFYSPGFVRELSQIKYALTIPPSIETGTNYSGDAGNIPDHTLASRKKYWDKTFELYLPLSIEAENDWYDPNTGVWRNLNGTGISVNENLLDYQASDYATLLKESYGSDPAYANYINMGARTLPAINSSYMQRSDIDNDVFMKLLAEAFKGKTVGGTEIGSQFKTTFEDWLCFDENTPEDEIKAIQERREAFCESLIMHLMPIVMPHDVTTFTSQSGVDISNWMMNSWWKGALHSAYETEMAAIYDKENSLSIPAELLYLKHQILKGNVAIVLEECVRFTWEGNWSRDDGQTMKSYGYRPTMYAPTSVLMGMFAQCSQGGPYTDGMALPYGNNIVRKTYSGTTKYPINFESRATDNNHKGWACAGKDCSNITCQRYGHITYRGRLVFNSLYAPTLRPVVPKEYLTDAGNSSKVSNTSYNPSTDSGNWFGGWGYAVISGDADIQSRQPELRAKVIYQTEDGQVIDTDNLPFSLPGTLTDTQPVWLLLPYDTFVLGGGAVSVAERNRINLKTIVAKDGRRYAAVQVISTTAVTELDNVCAEHGVADNCNLFSTTESDVYPAYIGIYKDIFTSEKWKILGAVGAVNQPVTMSYYYGGEDTTGYLKELTDYYSGGKKAEVIDTLTPTAASLKMRVESAGLVKDASDLRRYGVDVEGYNSVNNVDVTVVVRVREVLPIDAKDTVPEWRLTKRWNSVFDFVSGSKDYAFADFTVHPGAHDGCNHVAASGGVAVDQISQPNTSVARGAIEVFTKVPDINPANTLWATAIIESYTSISEGEWTATSILDQRTLAVKEKESPVGQINVTSWVSEGANKDFLSEVGIPTSDTGTAMTGSTSQTYEYITKYRNANGNNTITHVASAYRQHTEDEDGNDVCNCTESHQTLASPFQFSLSKAGEVKVTLTYNRYIPKDLPTATYASYATSVNGKTIVSAQSTVPLRLWPEVPMLYTTKQSGYANLPGITGVVYAAGAKERVLTPVSWHTLDYDAYVTPKAVGTAVATDARAVATWHDTKTPVIYKGAGVNMSFDLKLTKGSEKSATLTTKSYILDVGNTAIKNAWGNSAYSPSNINNDFLKTFAEQKDGKWAVKATGIENLKVNGVPDAQQKNTFAQVKNDLTYIENNHSSAEYPIVVRGGLLAYVYIGGTAYSPAEVKSVDLELYDALVGMHLINEDAAKSYETVFSCFEHFGGALVDEPLYVEKVNSVRHGGQPWSVAKDKGWYNEDSTVLTIRVYTTVFDLPASVFADKLPMTIKTSNNSLDTPVDKNQFFSKVEQGFSVLRYTFDANLNPYNQSDVATKTSIYMEHDSKVGGEFGDKAVDYGVPNVSILDTTNLG